MKFSRKIAPDTKPKQNFIIKKRLREDEIDFNKLRSYRLDRVKKELEKNNLEACILFDPVNVRYALDTLSMSVYNMHNLTRYCFVPVNGPVILYEYFNCENLSEGLNLIDEIRPAITWDYFSNGDQSEAQLKKWISEVKDLSNSYFKSKKIAIDVLNGPAVSALNKEGISVVDAKLILEQARVIKSPEEIKCMRSAIDVAEMGIVKMREQLKPGMTENELWAHNSFSVIPGFNCSLILTIPISATSIADRIHLISSGDFITLACSRINFASTTLMPSLFKAETAGPFKTSIAIFFDLK